MSAPPSSNPLTAEERQALEATHTWQRIVELRLDPVQGNFDAAHLKEINRRIFQDLPGLGFDNLAPGEFRPAAPKGRDWHKVRSLDTVRTPLHVAYSSMNSEALARLDTVLASARPDGLAGLKTREFADAIGKLYAELDYIHPFVDGNSRTLREFTRQLADAAGYNLDWERFTSSPGGRDVLYVARDLSVNALAMPHIQDSAIRRNITLSLDQFDGNRHMPNLLQDAVRPNRAIAFERLPKGEAIDAHPELEHAYRTLADAEAHFAVVIPKDAAARQSALDAVREHVQTKLDQGETNHFRQQNQEQNHQVAKSENSRSMTNKDVSQDDISPAPNRSQTPDLDR